MAWSDAAREASIAARRANGAAHQNGVAQVGHQSVSDAAVDVARNHPAGFSVRPDGSVPMKGYMVSVRGRTQEVDPNTMKSNTRAILEGYAHKNADALRWKGSHIGGWMDPATGRTHLDVTHNIPRQRVAVKVGRERNQIGIYDVKRNRVINTGGRGDL